MILSCAETDTQRRTPVARHAKPLNFRKRKSRRPRLLLLDGLRREIHFQVPINHSAANKILFESSSKSFGVWLTSSSLARMCRVWTCVSYIFPHSRRKTRSHLRLSRHRSNFLLIESVSCYNNMGSIFLQRYVMKISHICCWYYWVKSYEPPQIRRKSGLMNERLRPKRHWSHSSQQPVFCGKTFERISSIFRTRLLCRRRHHSHLSLRAVALLLNLSGFFSGNIIGC